MVVIGFEPILELFSTSSVLATLGVQTEQLKVFFNSWCGIMWAKMIRSDHSLLVRNVSSPSFLSLCPRGCLFHVSWGRFICRLLTWRGGRFAHPWISDVLLKIYNLRSIPFRYVGQLHSKFVSLPTRRLRPYEKCGRNCGTLDFWVFFFIVAVTHSWKSFFAAVYTGHALPGQCAAHTRLNTNTEKMQ